MLSTAMLAGSLLVCGSLVRGTALCDWDAAVEIRACSHCGAAVVFDPATHRTAPCRGCRPRPVALAAR
ncbi:hypothetical protein [Alienimonas californiensis]|uniref:hypothetical protein n=1 Tax=Alienimonas californiensis TaxID=2527989 RepID=UPI0011A6F76B|nr:hypothetical protein [Alienimonas californiensis]